MSTICLTCSQFEGGQATMGSPPARMNSERGLQDPKGPLDPAQATERRPASYEPYAQPDLSRPVVDAHARTRTGHRDCHS